MSGQTAREKRALMRIVHSGDAPDRRLRHAEAPHIPVGETFGELKIAPENNSGLVLAIVIVCVALPAGMWLGGLIVEAWAR